MSKQNVYDNEIFFEGYKKLREREVNANNLFEIPALLSIIPDLNGKSVLDLGCGFGDHCMMFAQKGACRVVGIDISSKMLEVAKAQNNHPKIEYLNMPIENINELCESFDVVISSLALHYVKDFEGVAKNVHGLLNENGVFVFSQEHPLVTCHGKGDRWTKDENGVKLHVNISNYGVMGERRTKWFVDDLQIYHRTFSYIVNTLTDSGFTVEKMIEPLPTEQQLEKYPEHYDLFHKPDFLIIRSKKR